VEGLGIEEEAKARRVMEEIMHSALIFRFCRSKIGHLMTHNAWRTMKGNSLRIEKR
jgi:hypothetical protein